MKYRKDLWSDFEDLMKQAGSGDCRLAINITEKRVRAHCAPWPLPRVVELSQGAVDAGPSVWRPTLAHQAARTRQRRRWLIPFGAMAIMLVGAAMGAPAIGLACAGIWLLAVKWRYELDADRWAARAVGVETMARVLERLGMAGRWRAGALRRRARHQLG